MATSEEKKTDAVTDFSSMSMPAFWHACLTIAWVFWRGALIEVWYTNFSFLPSFARTPSGPRFQVITHLFSTAHNHHVRLKVGLDGDEPTCQSLSAVYAGANWHERETWELFGIVFEGHPHLVKLLLPEPFEGHPLRKDFELMSRVAKPWPGAVEGEEEEEE